jgi:hypothetical protein
LVVGDAADKSASTDDSATAWRSSNGTTWSPAASTFTSVGGHKIYDLNGAATAPGGTRDMAAVTAVGTALIAVGNSSPSHGSSSQLPAYWHSTDGVHWHLGRLPVATGTYYARADPLAANGIRVVAIGSVQGKRANDSCSVAGADLHCVGTVSSASGASANFVFDQPY